MSMNAWTLTQEQASNFGMLDPLKLENKKKKSNRFAGMDMDGDKDNSAEEDDDDAMEDSGPKKKRQGGIIININLGTPKPSKLGAEVADNLYKTTTTTASMSRYPGAPVASFKHGNYRKATFGN